MTGFVSWPAGVKHRREVTFPVATLDFLPTVAELLGVDVPRRRTSWATDGVSLAPLFAGDGALDARPTPIGFQLQDQRALVNDTVRGAAWGNRGRLRAALIVARSASSPRRRCDPLRCPA